MPCPSMLEKKLLIMPRCNAKHWSAVFVFNPSFIELAQLRGYKDTEECLQPCFFRYCSIITDGNRPVPSSDGNLWFLNLVYSYANHCKAETPPGAPMEWLAPFGRDRYNEEYELGDIKKLWGTPCFPSIRIHKKDVPNLPKQGHEDGWNCGFGLVATIAIIMRDIVGSSDKNRLSFLNTFQAAQADLDCCPTNGTECAMFLRAGLIKPLTANGNSELFWDNDDYLTTLRNEWFDVFDQLAELENVTIPRRVNPRSKVSLSYITAKSDRKFPLRLLQKPNAMLPSMESAAAAESMLQMSENQPSTSTGPLNAAFDAEADSTKSSPKNMQDNQPVDRPASTDVSNKVDPPLDPIIEDPASHTNPSNSSATIPSVAPNAANPPASTEVSNKKDPLFDPKTSGINSSNEPASSSDIIPSVNSNADDFPSTTNDDFLDTNAAAPSDGSGKESTDDLQAMIDMLDIGDQTDEDGFTQEEKAALIKRFLASKRKQQFAALISDDSKKPKKPKSRKLPSAKKPNNKDVDIDATSNVETELTSMVPWLDIPTEREPNTWAPNWRSLGKREGNPRHFFGFEADDKDTKEKDKNNDDTLGSRKTLADFQPSQLTVDNVVKFNNKWKSFNAMGKAELNDDAMNQFVNDCFVAWGWSSNEQYLKDLQYFEAKMVYEMEHTKRESERGLIKAYYTDLNKAIQKERRYFRRQFEKEFRLNDLLTVTGLQYNKHTNKFVAKLQHQRSVTENAYIKKKRDNCPKGNHGI